MSDSIKSYDYVNSQNHKLSFGISRMEDIYTKRKGQQDEPHRHDFYTVVIVNTAKGQHVIDFEAYSLSEKQIYFIHPGQVHQVIEDEQSFGYAITFSTAFLVHNNISIDFIENLNLFHEFGNTPPLEANSDEFEKITFYCEQLLYTHNKEIKFQYDALGSWLKLLLIQCNNLCGLDEENYDLENHKGNLLHNYKDLVNKHYKQWHNVTEYANELHVTSDHLNRVIKSITGKTAKEHIQARITTAAKRLLFFSDLSNKELAYELGFSEPANFSAFFKKCTGVSPSEFKRRN